MKGIRHQDMYPFLYKIVRYKINKIQLIGLNICIRISTSGSFSGPINSVAGGYVNKYNNRLLKSYMK